jgi:hypothetical protein
MRSLPCLAASVLLLALLGAATAAKADTDISINPFGPTPAISFYPVTIDVRDVSPSFCTPVYLPPRQVGNTLFIQAVASTAFCIVGDPQTYHSLLSAGPLPPGTYTAEVLDLGQHVFAAKTFTVGGSPLSTLLLNGPLGPFEVQVSFTDPVTGAVRSGYPVALTEESGYFWFFDDHNIELTVKLLDGRGVNGHAWVFLASMTDLPFTVTVAQGYCLDIGVSFGPPCFGTKTYVNPGGNRNFIDVGAF